MASIGGDDAETAFLKAMRDQQESDDADLDDVTADNANNSIQENNSPNPHPEDEINIDFDDNGEQEPTLNDSTKTTQNGTTTEKIQSNGSGNSTPHRGNVTTA